MATVGLPPRHPLKPSSATWAPVQSEQQVQPAQSERAPAGRTEAPSRAPARKALADRGEAPSRAVPAREAIADRGEAPSRAPAREALADRGEAPSRAPARGALADREEAPSRAQGRKAPASRAEGRPEVDRVQIDEFQRGLEPLSIPARKATARNTINVLSLDGAGAWGVREAVILREIERRMDMPIAKIFQFIAGTSSGGLITSCLTRPDPYSAAEIVEFFRNRGAEIFKTSLLHRITTLNGAFGGPKYPSAGIDRVGSDVIGDTRMSEAITDVMLTAQELDLGPVGVTSFPVGPGHLDHPMFDAARGSSAFPACWTPGVLHTLGADAPVMRLYDGGFWATNPAPFGLQLAMLRNPQARNANVISIAAGAVSSSEKLPSFDRKGAVQLTSYVLSTSVVNNRGIAESEIGQYLEKGDYYARLSPLVVTKDQDKAHGISSFDDGSPEAMDRNIAQTEAWIKQNSGLIDEICAKLRAGLKSGRPKGPARRAPGAEYGYTPLTTRMFALPAATGATVIHGT